jgi:peptidyl-tRNA hydrolase
MQKLFVIVRADLPPGAQLAQSNHATAEFSVAHPEAFRDWAANQRNIVCLNVTNEAALADLLKLAQAKGVWSASFREPDFDGELTAIALGSGAEKIVSCLPLALRQEKRAA